MAKNFVNEAIASHKVVIFSKIHCPYCVMAKEQFKLLKQEFTAIELDNRHDGGEILAALGEITGGKTVPRVFVNGEFIGGGTDVKKMKENGKLSILLNACR